MREFGLKLIANLPDALEQRNTSLDRKQCVRLRHRRSTCSRCADACPTHAISWRDELEIDPGKCIDCGICAAVCPTGAWEAHAPTNAELLGQIKSRLIEGRPILFACSHCLETLSLSSADILPVQCLGRLDESIFVGAVVMGAQAVTLLDGACADCPHSAGRAIAGQMMQRANALLASFGAPGRITLDPRRVVPEALQPRPAKPEGGLSRRDLFKFLTGRAIKTTAITVNSVLGDEDPSAQKEARPFTGPLPAQVPPKRRFLFAALRRLGQPVETQWKDGIWAQFMVTEKCSGCQMCAFFCPTGALMKTEQAGKLGVTFNLASCIDCRLCQEICYRHGVTLSPGVDLQKVVSNEVDTFWMADTQSAAWNTSLQARFEKPIPSSCEKNK
jgi:formate hydrogenlyase subunit 6/NADH:ubiquinone oxidoreductase subunit I